MSLHKEIRLEEEICEHLGTHGWVYEDKVSAQYDRALALFPEDVIAWVQVSQPAAWAALSKSHGLNADKVLLERLRDRLDAQGTLEVVRHGLDIVGVRGRLLLAQFKPSLAMNEETMRRYRANRLRVVRQVRYSEADESCLDLVLFLNGIPVATAELKTDFTQSVEDAKDQYKYDRNPRPKGRVAEPLLSFPSGALVHFAVSNSEVYMTTKLAGRATHFLPFNKGNNGAAGNPPSTTGHSTAYLWEEVWERESWLEILGRYLVYERDEKKAIKRLIFPRFHQLDATRKLVSTVRQEGAGGKFLIQHSAGSGKTNSIAWTAHFLADLHDDEQRKVFDSVLVVSDRNVIDKQLQDAIFGFERTAGVVYTVKGTSGSKSKELAEALSGKKKIVVCTIQTFPFALEEVRKQAATQGKRFAVIADEAHSSQTGEAASKLKAVLSPEELRELEDGGEVSTEDILAAQMAGRAAAKGITYVAFTATPKAKTVELFGRPPHPDQPVSNENKPEPFHVYSMRQAIEEGFILDVLQNYTTYKLAFRLAHEGKEINETQVERSAAVKGLMRWVRLHPYNVSQKVQIVVEHFRSNVQGLLTGHAKAMVVVGSRLEAVRWQRAITKYIKERGYPLGALVAFSGQVEDADSGHEPLSESNALLNPTLRGRNIADAFGGDEFQILLVANKFQTGFDQPLLCGMYVDKRLGGIQAVQTLSRLNRAYTGPYGTKDTTFVLDFVNDPEEVLKAFHTYYETAQLESVTDPQLIFNLRDKLDGLGYYDHSDVDRVVRVELDPKAKQSELIAALTPVVDRLTRRFKAAQQAVESAKLRSDGEGEKSAKEIIDSLNLFKTDMGTFNHAYTFLSQVFDYGNTDVEKRAIFYKRLIPLLEFGRERAGIDLSKVVLTHHALLNRGTRPLEMNGEGQKLKPLTEVGSGAVQEKETALLSEIISRVNDLFDGDVTENDKLVYVNNVIKGKLLESEVLVQQAANNTKEQFANSPDLVVGIMDAVIDAFAAHKTMSKQALDSEEVRIGLRQILLGPAQLYEALRDRAASMASQ